MNFDILEEISNLKNPVRNETSTHNHSIHPYPAKYIPQIPNKIISEFTNERHLILDPFCGSGTTLLEAKILGRESVGLDLNPIGVLSSRVKTYSLTKEDINFFQDFKNKFSAEIETNEPLWIPEIPRIEHWFTEEAIIGLAKIVRLIRRIDNLNRRRILNLILSNIIVSVSNQESETRFAAKKRQLSQDKIFNTFLSKYDNIIKKLITTSSLNKFNTANSTVHLASTLTIDQYLNPNSVDLIVTSPPYLNSFDYYLYHKFRIYWISYPENLDEVIPVTVMQKQEIGSRYKYSGSNSEKIETFTNEMQKCFTSFNSILKPSKLLFLVIGDSILKGDFLKMDEYYEKLVPDTGFTLLSKVSYAMSGASRSFVSTNTVNKHYLNKQTHILVFQALNVRKVIHASLSTNTVLDSFTPALSKEVDELPLNISNGSSFYITSNNVTELTHGLVKYPAKYIPQIPSWAIKAFSDVGDVVLDPFNGSGTTSVECLINERNFIGVDINPLSILASEVKVTFIPSSILTKNLAYLKKVIDEKRASGEYDHISFDLQDFWFNKGVIDEINLIRSSIMLIKNKQVRNLMLLSLSSIIKKVSNLDEGQLKVKRDAKKVLRTTPNVIELFFKRFDKDCSTIQKLKHLAKSKTFNKHHLGSAFNLNKIVKGTEKIDLIVTSPPYINAMNYPMYHRYELLLLGLISPDNYIKHQSDYIGTERVYSKEYSSFKKLNVTSENFNDLNAKLELIYNKEPKRYFITKRYFDEMFAFFTKAYQLLKDTKKMVIVCGTNTIKGVPINTSFELSKLAQAVGFKELFHFSYEIRKHRFKLTRHETAGKINNDIIIVLEK